MPTVKQHFCNYTFNNKNNSNKYPFQRKKNRQQLHFNFAGTSEVANRFSILCRVQTREKKEQKVRYLGGLETKKRDWSGEDKAAEIPSLTRGISKVEEEEEADFGSLEKLRIILCNPSMLRSQRGDKHQTLKESVSEKLTRFPTTDDWLGRSKQGL